MIRKLIRQMLTAQIFSALTVSLCLLIDNIMIGRFLGVPAIAAYGLANPILLVIGAIGSMLSAGVQVACGKSLGRGSQEETNRGYSSAIGLTIGISLVFVVFVIALRSPLASWLGAGTEGALYDDTRAYLLGFILGAPASMGALILVPFLQMAGMSGLLIAAVLAMTVADVALDLLNVLVFHGGMFGMGLASALSYYAALIVGGVYFFSKKCVYRFSLRMITKEKIAELFRGGVPTVFTMASTVVLILILNRVLLGVGGAVAVAAYSVITTIGNSCGCIATGIGGVSLTMSGILYHEEDRGGLREQLALMARYSVILGLAVGALLVIFAPAAVSLFIPEAGEAQSMTILGVRLYAAGLIPCCLNNALKNSYQGTGRVLRTELISCFEGAIVPAIAAVLLSIPFGTTGVWFFFALGEGLTLLGVVLLAWRQKRSLSWDSLLLLPEDFSVPTEDLIERQIATVEDATDTAQAAQEFCLDHGLDEKTALHVALCIEEMATNAVLHGFTKDQKEHRLSVRVLHKADHLVIRFRDNCRAFDPVHYVPKKAGKDSLGINLVLKLADEARYTYSLNLNNLTLILQNSATRE